LLKKQTLNFIIGTAHFLSQDGMDAVAKTIGSQDTISIYTRLPLNQRLYEREIMGV